MIDLRDQRKIEFIRSVVKELNYALNSQSVGSTLGVQIMVGFKRHDPDCYESEDTFELTYTQGD